MSKAAKRIQRRHVNEVLSKRTKLVDDDMDFHSENLCRLIAKGRSINPKRLMELLHLEFAERMELAQIQYEHDLYKLREVFRDLFGDRSEETLAYEEEVRKEEEEEDCIVPISCPNLKGPTQEVAATNTLLKTLDEFVQDLYKLQEKTTVHIFKSQHAVENNNAIDDAMQGLIYVSRTQGTEKEE